jgi:hypothetical protein
MLPPAPQIAAAHMAHLSAITEAHIKKYHRAVLQAQDDAVRAAGLEVGHSHSTVTHCLVTVTHSGLVTVAQRSVAHSPCLLPHYCGLSPFLLCSQDVTHACIAGPVPCTVANVCSSSILKPILAPYASAAEPP